MGNVNITNRLPLTHDPADMVDIYSAADFSKGTLPNPILAPDGEMRQPLALGMKYTIHKAFPWPLMLVPTHPAEGTLITEISSSSLNVPILLAGSSTPHFWGRDVSNLRFSDSLLVDISNGGAGRGTIPFDLVGQGPDISATQPSGVLFLIATGLINFLEPGNLVDMSVIVSQSGWGFHERGFVVRTNVPAFGHNLSNVIGLQIGLPTTAPLITFQGAQSTVSASGGSVILRPGNAMYGIDSASTGTFEFNGVAYGGTASGDFFRPDISESITAFAPMDIAFASVSDSTVNPGVDSTIHFSTIQKFTRGQNVLGDTIVTYDGLHSIVRVAADLKSVDINVAFGSTDTGNVKITRVTAPGHGLVQGETQTSSGTTSYNQTGQILFRVDDDNVDISVAFNGDDATGTIASVSKNGRSVGVDSTACGAQPDSRRIAFGTVNGNATATTIALANTYQAIDASGFAISPVSERWELADATTGTYRYLGNRPITAREVANITAVKTGSTENYRFAVSLNGDIPDFATAPFSAMEVKTTKVTTPLLSFNSVGTNDTVQIMVAAEGHTDAPTITDLQWESEG